MIAGIILAAGRSSRLGRPKQLLDLQGNPLIRHTAQRVLASSLDEVFVVVGHEAEAVAAALRDLRVRVVQNPDAALGQSTSVRAGLEALPVEAEAAMFLLGDQPGVDPSVIDALADAWRTSGAAIVAPRYTNGLGNPVLFDRRAFPALALLQGDIGAKPVVRAYEASGELHAIPVSQPAPSDVDTDDDYKALIDSFRPRSTS